MPQCSKERQSAAPTERGNEMAYLNTTFRPAIADRVRALFEAAREARAKRAIYKRTVNELSALSNRDLADLGITRYDIETLAWTQAYGA
jgi:uncharacterized protein YjiS (DUF1127 family)